MLRFGKPLIVVALSQIGPRDSCTQMAHHSKLLLDIKVVAKQSLFSWRLLMSLSICCLLETRDHYVALQCN